MVAPTLPATSTTGCRVTVIDANGAAVSSRAWSTSSSKARASKAPDVVAFGRGTPTRRERERPRPAGRVADDGVEGDRPVHVGRRLGGEPVAEGDVERGDEPREAGSGGRHGAFGIGGERRRLGAVGERTLVRVKRAHRPGGRFLRGEHHEHEAPRKRTSATPPATMTIKSIRMWEWQPWIGPGAARGSTSVANPCYAKLRQTPSAAPGGNLRLPY